SSSRFSVEDAAWAAVLPKASAMAARRSARTLCIVAISLVRERVDVSRTPLGAAAGAALFSCRQAPGHCDDMKDLGAFLLATLLGLLPLPSGSAPADDVLAADAAFAARAAEVGHHEAFVEYLADDGVLFRPEAVPGQAWL